VAKTEYAARNQHNSCVANKLREGSFPNPTPATAQITLQTPARGASGSVMAEPESVAPEGVAADPAEVQEAPEALGHAPAEAPGEHEAARENGNGVSEHEGVLDITVDAGLGEGGAVVGGHTLGGAEGGGAGTADGAEAAAVDGDAPLPPGDAATLGDAAAAGAAAEAGDAPEEPAGPRKRRHAWGPPAAGEFPTLEELAKPKPKKKSRWESNDDDNQALALIPYKGGASTSLIIPGQMPREVKLSNGMQVRRATGADVGFSSCSSMCMGRMGPARGRMGVSACEGRSGAGAAWALLPRRPVPALFNRRPHVPATHTVSPGHPLRPFPRCGPGRAGGPGCTVQPQPQGGAPPHAAGRHRPAAYSQRPGHPAGCVGQSGAVRAAPGRCKGIARCVAGSMAAQLF
jgi:hypothetical protein